MPAPYKKFQRSALSLAILVSMPQLVQATDGEWFSLGTLPDDTSSYATAISADGSAVIGSSYNSANGEQHAFRWTSAGMQDLGTLGGTYSYARAVSADGTAVAGNSNTLNNNEEHAYRWTTTGGMQDLGTLGGTYSWATAISADGAAVVGGSYLDSNYYVERAFRWTAGDGMVDLGTLGGSYSWAADVSADGSVVIGQSSLQYDSSSHAFRWTNGVMKDLGTLGGTYSYAVAVSADGSAVAGSSNTLNNNEQHAFRWTTTGGMQDLGTLGGTYSWANAISADGSAVAGSSDTGNDNGQRAFRWTAGSGMQDLGTLGGIDSYARAISADGSVVVGEDYGSGRGEDRQYSSQAFRWSEADGMQSIADWTGVSDTGYTNTAATGVSADGQTVVGYGYQESLDEYTAWLARKGGIINPDQWLQSLNVSQQVYQSGQYLTDLALDGSHHRPLALYANTTQSNSCVWANGDVGNYGYGRDATVGLAELGICGASGDLTFGGSIGNAWQNQDFDYDGNLDVDGQFFTGEVNWQVPDSQVLLSALGMYGSYNADIKRGYLNGAGEATSKGNTDMDTSTLRLRADWLDAFSVAEVSLSPWTSVTATKTNVDSYTETTGPFPASFDSQDETATEARLGLTGRYALTATTTLLGTIETVHSMDDQGPNLTGEGVGLFSFDQSGQNTESNWQRVGVEVDQLVGKAGLVSVSLYGANEGQDANGSLAVKYIHSF